jgi:serine/threonine protein kinase
VVDEPTASDTPPGLRPGSRFGHYRLKRLLGRGGFGEVYEADDTVMDRAVALKLLAPPYSQNQVFRQRLYREARAAGKLHEPHVVPIHQCGEIDGQVYIDMRLIVGTDLQNVLARDGPLSPPRAVAIVRQIAAALDAAHRAQMVHRDIKPANILLTDDDFACLVDFGLANAATDAKLTSSGTTIGTFAYMAPERFSNTDVGHRADIYALACVLYECLTGSLPYATGDLPALINAHLTAPIPRPSQHWPQIPAAFDDVIAMGLAKNPQDRYASAGELARAAHQALSPPDQDDADTILADTQAAATGDHAEFKQHPRSHQGARFHAGAEGVVIDADNLDDGFDAAGNLKDPKLGEGFERSFRRGRRASPELPILDVVVEPPFLRRHSRIAIPLATAVLIVILGILLIDVLPAFLEHRSPPPSSQPAAPPPSSQPAAPPPSSQPAAPPPTTPPAAAAPPPAPQAAPD